MQADVKGGLESIFNEGALVNMYDIVSTRIFLAYAHSSTHKKNQCFSIYCTVDNKTLIFIHFLFIQSPTHGNAEFETLIKIAFNEWNFRLH